MAFYRCGGGNPTGNATKDQVLNGKTFSNDEGTGLAGTMPNKTGWSASLNNSTRSVTVPKGYHDGTKTVSISSTDIPDRTGWSSKLANNQTSVTIPKGYHDGTKTVSMTTQDVTGVRAKRTSTNVYDYSAGNPVKKVTVNPVSFSGAVFGIHERHELIDMNIPEFSGPLGNDYDCWRYINSATVPNDNPASNVYTISAAEYPTFTLPATHSYGSFNTTAVFNRGACGMHLQKVGDTWISTNPGDNVINLTTDWIGAMLVIQIRENAKAPWGADVRLISQGAYSTPIIQSQYSLGGTPGESCYCHVQCVYNIHEGQRFEVSFYQPNDSKTPVVGKIFKIISSFPAGYFV